MLVCRIEPHGLAELVARGFVVADFEQRVRQIFADGRAVGRERDGFAESGDGLIVMFLPKRVIGLIERLICRDPNSARPPEASASSRIAVIRMTT